MNHAIVRWKDAATRLLDTAMSCWPALILVVLHEVLAQVLATRNVVAVLLSPSARTPWLEAIAAISFVVLRLVVICVVPSLIAFKLGGALVSRDEAR